MGCSYLESGRCDGRMYRAYGGFMTKAFVLSACRSEDRGPETFVSHQDLSGDVRITVGRLYRVRLRQNSAKQVV
jgi:hypothetical protein